MPLGILKANQRLCGTQLGIIDELTASEDLPLSFLQSLPMAPIRRYLRISKYSVIECRIYPDRPSDARWLLDARDPGLPRVFAAIRPLVRPRLREANERLWMRKKSKPVKDVVSEGKRLC